MADGVPQLTVEEARLGFEKQLKAMSLADLIQAMVSKTVTYMDSVRGLDSEVTREAEIKLEKANHYAGEISPYKAEIARREELYSLK